jgi:uncharacterized protein (DUF952 family)
MDPKHIYKIFRPSEWDDFQSSGQFAGSLDDLRDGFIHFSTNAQVPGTLAKYYTDRKDIVLAKIVADGLGDDLKYETSRGGQAFPHLYAALSMSSVTQYWVLPADEDGLYAVEEILGAK